MEVPRSIIQPSKDNEVDLTDARDVAFGHCAVPSVAEVIQTNTQDGSDVGHIVVMQSAEIEEIKGDGTENNAIQLKEPSRRPTDEDLIKPYLKEAIDGDSHAIDAMLAIIRPIVVRYCNSRFGDEDMSGVAADDLAQDILLAVTNALPTYTLRGRPFMALVFGITKHKIIDARRRKERIRTDPVADIPESSDTAKGPEAQFEGSKLSEKFNVLLATLPPQQREIVWLRVIVGLSADETAATVGSTPGAVRVAQHRGLARLRKAYEAEEAWEY
jgi:RNA polymerase sigma-70 factor (ECF subfamily)